MMFKAFPIAGAPSPVLSNSYQKPRWVLLPAAAALTFCAVLRYLLLIPDFIQPAWWQSMLGLRILVYWAMLDALIFLGLASNMFFCNCKWHHREYYLNNMETSPAAMEIIHCLTILHCTEPEEQLYDLIADLAAQPSAGRKVLLVGMEQKSPAQEEKLQHIRERFASDFVEILYTVHRLRQGEIPGTGSNHFETQVAAQLHFKDVSNVILSKFDCNMRLAGPLLQEMEAAWVQMSEEERHSVTFMPNTVWSVVSPDESRLFLELAVSFGMCASMNMAPYAMSFVSGSLTGAVAAGYTPPGLLAEDELTFMKKRALLAGASTCRLSATIVKLFPESTHHTSTSSYLFFQKVFYPKICRWYVGWLEVFAYFGTWLCFRSALPHHPPVKYPLKTIVALVYSISRMYLALVLPFASIPMPVVFVVAMQRLGSEPHFYIILKSQTVIFYIAVALFVSMLVRTQIRLYQEFAGLRFRVSTVLLVPLGGIIMSVLPLWLLFAFFKHGLTNSPVVHGAARAPEEVELPDIDQGASRPCRGRMQGQPSQGRAPPRTVHRHASARILPSSSESGLENPCKVPSPLGANASDGTEQNSPNGIMASWLASPEYSKAELCARAELYSKPELAIPLDLSNDVRQP